MSLLERLNLRKLLPAGVALLAGFSLGLLARKALTRRGAEDAKLARLRHFSQNAAGQTGRLLHLLHLELMRPGAGVWFQQRLPDEPIPPWPEGGAEDPVEELFGEDAN